MSEQIFNQFLIGLGLSPEVEREPTGVGATGPLQGPTTAHVPGSNLSSTLPPGGYIPQKSGDPNYYPTTPKFDSRGFWHCAGTMAPTDATLPFALQALVPSGIVGTLGQNPGEMNTSVDVIATSGQWIKQGQVERNSLATNLWVWYPQAGDGVVIYQDKYIYVAGRDEKSANAWKAYMLSQGKKLACKNAVRLFQHPDYWVEVCSW